MPGSSRSRLPPAFFERMPDVVAPELLGKLVARTDGRVARLVEVEAYAQDDPAAHTFRGKSQRNQSMFGPPGHLYVYFSYGVHWCANLVCGPQGYGAGVLLRAAEPLEGIDLMRNARGRDSLRDLCSGPGRLAQAFGISRALDGSDATGTGVISLLDDGTQPDAIVACPRRRKKFVWFAGSSAWWHMSQSERLWHSEQSFGNSSGLSVPSRTRRPCSRFQPRWCDFGARSIRTSRWHVSHWLYCGASRL